MTHPPILRVVRPTDDIGRLKPFYIDGLGFQILASFEAHDGFDGLILGHPKAPYHLEFTRHPEHVAGRSPSKDHLLVFYLPDDEEYQSRAGSMKQHGFMPVQSFNPYWDRMGQTFEDPDCYRVVLQNAAWAV